MWFKVNRWNPYLILGMGWLLLLLPFLYFKSVPLPGVNDEFSYLLAAETYAAGRLTNPSPEVPAAFQSFHIITVPTYMSKYLPGVGLQLALGILLGHPIFGVWLTVLVSAMATYWMLRTNCPKYWSIFGGFSYLLFYGLGSYFGFSYWGGSLLLLQGLLVTGSMLRLMQRSDWRHGLILGLGAGGMLLTRPVEGGFFTFVWLMALVVKHWHREKAPPLRLFFQSLIPAGMVVLLAAGFLMATNFATTGNALRPAYMQYEDMYSNNSIVSWGDTHTPQAVLPIPPQFESLSERVDRYKIDSWSKGVTIFTKTLLFWRQFYLPFCLLIPIGLGLLFELKRGSVLGIVAMALISAKLIHPFALVASHHNHYTAAWAALLLLLMIQGLRSLFAWRSKHSWVCILRRTVFLATVLAAFLTYGRYITKTYGNQPYPFAEFGKMREEIASSILKSSSEVGRTALIVVDYSSNHIFDQELVYNAPMPGDAAVIWTQFINLETLGQLDKAYPNREWWFLSYGENVAITRTRSADKTVDMLKSIKK